jgi:hypothetical protein
MYMAHASAGVSPRLDAEESLSKPFRICACGNFLNISPVIPASLQ